MSRTYLEKQCESLSLLFKDISLEYDGRPEPALLKHFESFGYVGSFSEGCALLTALKALMLDKLAELNIFNDRDDACLRYLEAQFIIHRDSVNDIIGSIQNTSRDKYLSNLHEILDRSFGQVECSIKLFKCCEALFDAIETEVFMAVATKFSEDPYSYRSGWPDLTLVKGQEVRFIEVKTTDKLHKSQLLTIPAFREVLPYEFSVYRVRR